MPRPLRNTARERSRSSAGCAIAIDIAAWDAMTIGIDERADESTVFVTRVFADG